MTAAVVAVRERPLPFSGPMARAAHEFRKTQTRRVAKLPQWILDDAPAVSRELTTLRAAIHCPYGQPGDRLWVKEAYRLGANLDALAPSLIPPGQLGRIAFEADGEERTPWPNRGRYRHGRFMPRRFSRTMLEVTAVRVERVQDISEADAIAEGIESVVTMGTHRTFVNYAPGLPAHLLARDSYRSLWDSLNAARGYGWDANPWVRVLSFERVRA